MSLSWTEGRLWPKFFNCSQIKHSYREANRCVVDWRISSARRLDFVFWTPHDVLLLSNPDLVNDYYIYFYLVVSSEFPFYLKKILYLGLNIYSLIFESSCILVHNIWKFLFNPKKLYTYKVSHSVILLLKFLLT